MPFINLKVNTVVNSDQETKLKTAFGKAITCIRGKSEGWLMVNIEDGQRLYFKGDKQTPNAFVEVKIYGSASRQEYDALTSELTGIISDLLAIAPDRIYIKYEEVENWGYSGFNF